MLLSLEFGGARPAPLGLKSLAWACASRALRAEPSWRLPNLYEGLNGDARRSCARLRMHRRIRIANARRLSPWRAGRFFVLCDF
jgi:hypothetical protein